MQVLNPQIGDEHVSGRVGHHQRDPAGSRYLLRRHTTGPEHWDFIISDLHGVSVFGELKVVYPELLGRAYIFGFSLS